jgi:hypothetical protein
MRVQPSGGSAVERPRRPRKQAAAEERRAPAQPPLPPALESLFGLIAEPVRKLEAAPGGPLTLREIGLLLGDVLDWLEEDQTILQAADRLYEAAFALQDARQRRSTCAGITDRTLKARADAVPVALTAFRASLITAKPNARARARHITW